MDNQPISLFETIDPDILDRLATRQEEITRGASVNSKIAAALALGSIPIALGALARDVYAQTPTDVLDVLQFALKLEYLEARFYANAVAATGLIPAADFTIFSTISGHETVHVTALKQLITQRSSTPAAEPTFNFAAYGTGFTFAVSQYATFQALAQGFEDTGVRAYKGQAGRLVGDKAALTAALSIHAVEAEHASQVRRLRGQKGWITSNSRGDLPAFTQPIYDGEDNISQGGVDLSTLTSFSTHGGVNSATEAFDEPLTQAQVLAIVTPFLTA